MLQSSGLSLAPFPKLQPSSSDHYPASLPAYLMDITLGHSDLTSPDSVTQAHTQATLSSILPVQSSPVQSSGSFVFKAFPELNYPSQP